MGLIVSGWRIFLFDLKPSFNNSLRNKTSETIYCLARDFWEFCTVFSHWLKLMQNGFIGATKTYCFTSKTLNMIGPKSTVCYFAPYELVHETTVRCKRRISDGSTSYCLHCFSHLFE